MANAAVQMEGWTDVQRALKYVDKGTRKAVRDGFKEAAEPVRSTSESMALADISNLGPEWSRMKVGVTTKELYVAPAARRRGGSARPNLGRRLMESMLRAVKRHEFELVAYVEKSLDNLIARAGF